MKITELKVNPSRISYIIYWYFKQDCFHIDYDVITSKSNNKITIIKFFFKLNKAKVVYNFKRLNK